MHYALGDFDSIWLHCIKLFIRQSIDRDQIFDMHRAGQRCFELLALINFPGVDHEGRQTLWLVQIFDVIFETPSTEKCCVRHCVICSFEIDEKCIGIFAIF